MPQDPHATFDQNVLDLIERSPVGAVPRTPAYQDALERLTATHQIYPDADHPNGLVTVRSLASRPCFHAQNLDALQQGAIAREAVESNATIFDRYIAALPTALRARAESVRAKVAGRPAQHRKHGGVIAHETLHSLILVPGAGPNPGIPGNYLYGFVIEPADGASGSWAIHLHDSDDGAAMCDMPTLADALAKLEEIVASAPFHLNELGALGFRSN